MSGAVLQHGGRLLNGSNVTLTVGDADRVECLQLTGSVPTSLAWYDAQGQLVSRDPRNKVNQANTGGGRVAYLRFQSYQQSQGGKYECRVTVPGNNLEKLPVCIGECYPLDGRLCVKNSKELVQLWPQLAGSRWSEQINPNLVYLISLLSQNLVTLGPSCLFGSLPFSNDQCSQLDPHPSREWYDFSDCNSNNEH